MDLASNRLSEPVAEVTAKFLEVVDGLSSPKGNYLVEEVNSEVFENVANFEEILSKYSFDYKIDTEGIIDPEELKKVENFNTDLDLKAKDVIFASGIQKALDSILNQHLQILTNGEDEQTIPFKTTTLSKSELKSFNKLSIMLDYQIYLYLNTYPFMKHIIYDSLSQALMFLFQISTFEVDKFWYWVETREKLILDKLFDRGIVSDRISLLEICNSLTDKYIVKDSRNKTVSYRKDSFNDTFQYRVRVFLSNVFAFEDNTGLNKYFHIANRTVSEGTRVKSPFLEDIIYLQKLFNDPFNYLKKSNSIELKKIVERVLSVYNYLLGEEVAWQGKNKADQFAIPKPKTESEKQFLTKKYSNLKYFPENYWISAWSGDNKAEQDKLADEDKKFFKDQFLHSKTRLQYLTMIYIIANLYFELLPSSQKEFLRSSGIPPNVKHITDETLPEIHKGFFLKVKKEMFNVFRTSDNQFAFLVQHIALSEKIWWSWLIYGKDPKTSKSFFVDKLLSEDELQSINDKSLSILPYKEKRYFNTFITPQLSRKMKTARGLDRLEKPSIDTTSELKRNIETCTESIATETDSAKKADLVEYRNALLWKQLKQQRLMNWLDFSTLLNPEMLTSPEVEKEEREEKEEKEEETMEQEDAKDIKDIKDESLTQDVTKVINDNDTQEISEISEIPEESKEDSVEESKDSEDSVKESAPSDSHEPKSNKRFLEEDDSSQEPDPKKVKV